MRWLVPLSSAESVMIERVSGRGGDDAGIQGEGRLQWPGHYRLRHIVQRVNIPIDDAGSPMEMITTCDMDTV